MIRTLDRLLIVAKRKPLLLAGFRLSNMDIEENLPYFPRFSNKVPKSKRSLSKNVVFAQLPLPTYLFSLIDKTTIFTIFFNARSFIFSNAFSSSHRFFFCIKNFARLFGTFCHHSPAIVSMFHDFIGIN